MNSVLRRRLRSHGSSRTPAHRPAQRVACRRLVGMRRTAVAHLALDESLSSVDLSVVPLLLVTFTNHMSRVMVNRTKRLAPGSSAQATTDPRKSHFALRGKHGSHVGAGLRQRST